MLITNKKFNIITVGCKTNTVESNDIISQLESLGACFTEEFNQAQIIVINTCCVTKKAETKSQYFINKAIKAKNVEHIIIVGCYSQLVQQEIKHPKIMILLGTQYKSIIKTLIHKYKDKTINWFQPYDITPLFEIISKNKNRTRAFYKIQDGCDNSCSYCIIPYVRGKSRSLEHNEILMDIHELANKKNYKEIVLTGINLGSYNDHGFSFFELLEQINYMPGDFRVRLSSLEPFYLTYELIDLITNNKQRWCQHFHISLQNCNDAILSAMNRKCKYNDFYDLCKYIKSKNELASITVDYIIGFPTETQQVFNDQLETLKNSYISSMNIFKFSPRPNTIAISIKNTISATEITNRYETISKVNSCLSDKYLSLFINKKVNVLFEAPKIDTQQQGHSQYFFNVVVYAKSNLVGQLKEVTIKEVKNDSLIGVI